MSCANLLFQANSICIYHAAFSMRNILLLFLSVILGRLHHMLCTKYKLKGSGFSKKLFFNILISFMVLVFLLVASFFLIFSNIYKSTIYENITSESMSSLERFNMEFDSLFSQLKQMNISNHKKINLSFL